MSNYNFSISQVDPDLEIDFMDLQPPVAMQASLYGYYSDKAVDARAERDSAVNELDRITASVELEIREDAAKSGEKLTEAKVNAKVEQDKRVVDLKIAVVEKNRVLQRFEAKCRALDHKRSMLESAVRMMLSKSNVLSEKGVADDWVADESQRIMRNQLRVNK